MKRSVQQFWRKALQKNAIKRRLFFFGSDILLLSLAMLVSFWLRFDENIPPLYKKSLLYFIPLALLLKVVFLAFFKLYDISWRFVSLRELIRLFYSLSLGSLSLGMILFLLKDNLPFKAFPRSILLLDYILSIFLLGALRISKRAYLEGMKRALKWEGERVRLLIIGAGAGGEKIVREMLGSKNSQYLPVGFIDDDPSKLGVNIHGIKVLGNREDIPEIIGAGRVDEVLIAIPSAPSREIKKIVEIIRNSNTTEKIRILPSVTDMINGRVTMSDIHEIELGDLLGRDQVEIHFEAIQKFLQEKTVLITGAGGSIGFELAKAVLQFQPERLVVIDNDDTEIYHLLQRLKFSAAQIIPIIGDVKDRAKIASVLEKYTPQILMHSAAFKHVPLLEFYPEEAVKTNVLGTKILAELSLQHGLEKFVFISTDKAINPTSVMGATKRVGEELLKVMNLENKTKFISVRFGNVLGSRGSVIPLFQEQIKKGGPVTVTHPEMKRYFMSTSEAVLLVLEAASLGHGGEVFVLDMGEPIKIVDLAKEMIKLSGYEPDVDIPIVFSHVRPGEKLFEELLGTEEGVEPTAYQKILKLKDTKIRNAPLILKKIEKLIHLSSQGAEKAEIAKLLGEIVPTYKPSDHEPPFNIL